MSLFTIRQPVEMKVTGTRGFVTEIWQTDQAQTRYKVLHVSGGERRTTWMPELELAALPPGEYPPFPDPFVTVSEAE